MIISVYICINFSNQALLTDILTSSKAGRILHTTLNTSSKIAEDDVEEFLQGLVSESEEVEPSPLRLRRGEEKREEMRMEYTERTTEEGLESATTYTGRGDGIQEVLEVSFLPGEVIEVRRLTKVIV